MKLELFIFFFGLAVLSSCANSGYHPNYIISDTSLEEAPVQCIEKEDVQ
jgi:hypothetical protein